MKQNEMKWSKSMINSEMKEDDNWFSLKDATIKTAKNENGSRQEQTNATVLVRLAKRMNITGHSIVDKYYGSNSGINIDRQLNGLKDLRYEMMNKHFAEGITESAFINIFAEPLASMTNSAEEATTKTAFKFGEAQDGIMSGLTDDTPTATATETDGYLLEEFDLEFINANVDSAMIREAIIKLYQLNANGKFYQYGSKSIKATDRPEWIEKGLKSKNDNIIFSGLFRQPMADLLQVRAKAQSTLASTAMNSKAKFKHWFTELIPMANRTAQVKQTMIKVVSYVMHHSGRNFWAKRIAWAVSPAFVEDFKEYIGFNQEVADSPVVGGSAKDWHWPYEANDWEASATESVDFSSMGLDLNDLKNL